MNHKVEGPKPNYTPIVSFRAETKSKVKLDMSDIELGDNVTAIVHGKATRLSADEYGNSLELKVSKIELKKSGKSMIDALKEIKGK